MKILLLSYEFPPLGGGGAKVVYGLGCEYARMGHDVHVLTMGFKELPSEENVENMRVFRVPGIRRNKSRCSAVEMVPYILAASIQGIALVKKHRYDCIHAHFIFPDGLIASCIKIRYRIPFIVTAHGSDVPGYNPNRFIMLHKILAPIWQHVVKSIPHIVFPSRSLQCLFQDSAKSSNGISIIPNGIERTKLDADRTKKNNILLVTRLFERKGVQYFLEAVRDLKADYHIHIVGDGPYMNTLQEKAIGIPMPITFHGYLDNNSKELRDLFETARFFVFTSESENFPIVLLEAMLAGTTIITTEGTGCAEVVGDTARLVPAQNPQKILEVLEELVNNPAETNRLGQRARERVETLLTWDSIAKQYIGMLEQTILQERNNGRG